MTSLNHVDRPFVSPRAEAPATPVHSHVDQPAHKLGRRIAIFAYGVLAYVLFLGVFLYAIGWIGNFVVPRAIDGAPTQPLGVALLVNVGLILLFGLQHSVMARPAFKRWWTRVIPPQAERSTYVLATNLALIAMFWFWQPMGGEVWRVEHPAAKAVLWGLYAAGWALVFVSTCLINHFDLFGLRHVWLQLLGRPYTHLRFATPGPYKLVRHPLYVGWLTVFWATPTMTGAHLLFALLTTAYILTAIRWEERDLVAHHGRAYAEYRRRVPMLIPGLRSKPRNVADAVESPARAV